MTESEELIDIFNNNFAFLKGSPIVLYGLGFRTEILINNLKDFNIVALMDSNSFGYKAYGIDVIEHKDVIKISKNIILVCVYDNANVIYKNIAYLEDYGINIYHVSGKKMQKDTTEINNSISYLEKDFIISLIDNYDIISFDIFDTLISRKVFHISDIFAYIDRFLKENYNLDINFIENRILAEKEAYHKFNDSFTLDNIYDILKYKINIDYAFAEKIKFLEIDFEKKLSRKREEIVYLLNYCIDKKKEIILVSDMYLKSDIIKDILDYNNIKFNGEIFISCDIGKSKHNGSLWEHINKLYKNKKILHIGDNENSDVKQASTYNIKGVKINSPIESFKNSIIKDSFEKYDLNLDDRLILGNFISYIFNSPFINYSSKININVHFDIGYLFFGPLIYNFMIWLVNECKKKDINKILFISRDAYILDILYKSIPNINMDGIYFYASRQALSYISIFNKEDIIDNIEINYKTVINMRNTFNRFLENRFGINVKENDIYNNKLLLDISKEELINHILNSYCNDIIQASSNYRKEYFNFINKYITDKDNLAFIGFLGYGSTQFYLQKILKNKMHFFYFATSSRIKYLNLKNINTLYGSELNTILSDNPLLKALVCESVMTAPNGSFVKFENSNPIFDDDDDERYNSGINRIHEGIIDFFNEFKNFDNNFINRKYNENFILDIFNLFVSQNKINTASKIRESFIIIDHTTIDGSKKTWK